MFTTIKTYLFTAFVLLLTSFTYAQDLKEIPKDMHGFWHFEVETKGDWDGMLIGKNYVENFYQLYYVEEIIEKENNTLQIFLNAEEGASKVLTISNVDGKQGQFQFNEWEEPKFCNLLDSPTDLQLLPLNELPSPLFNEWTTGDGKLSFQLDLENKLLYKNQTWEVIWAGYYLDKEYRMLIKNGDWYKLIYLNNITDKSLRVVCNLEEELNIPLAAKRDIYKILGNWAEESSNKWRLGFFEENAIFDGKVYEYKSFERKGSNFKVVIGNETKETKLKIKLGDSTICKVSFNGAENIDLFKCDKYLPAYKTTDSDMFADSEFKKIDTVTIRGYLRNNPIKKPFSVSFNDPIKDEQVEFFADVDAKGTFTLKFPLLNTTQVYLDWGRMTKMDVVEPGESYFLFFDFATKQHLIWGDNERFHNEFAAYKVYRANRGGSREEYERIRNLPQLDFLKIERKELKDGYAHLENYIAANPNVSERFKYFWKDYYRFQSGFSLMQRYFTLDRRANEKFPQEFMTYVNDTLFQNTPPKPITLVREYFTFIRDYINYEEYCKGRSSQSISHLDGLFHMEEKGLINLTDEVKQAISATKEQMKVLQELQKNKADSVQIANAINNYKETIEPVQKLFKEEPVKSFMADEWNAIVSEKFAQMRFDSKFEILDEIITDSVIKDVLEAQQFYKYIDDEKTALPDFMKQLMDERLVGDALTEEIRKQNKYYTELGKQDILYVESLKNTEHLKDAKDADSLFTALTAPYRGKVIYIDFWGTWCGPCKAEMRYVRESKEALKDKDVIFMYFANNSPEASWKNVIKEYQLTGGNVVHYRLPPAQQSMLERRLSIRSFPTYILMDKEGNIVNMKPPRPSQKHELVKEISNLFNP